MDPQDLNRRDFHRLAVAAFGGIVAGAAVGSGASAPPNGTAEKKADPAAKPPEGETKVATAEPHACRGLNTCKTDKNECAGLSTCATVEHACAEQNDCKYLGGCGRNPGANECKGKGGCQVPMVHGDAWDRARKAFEERMKMADKKFGDAPPAPEKKES